jgi:hypothetical protein
VFVEAREQTRQVVQIRTHHVRGTVACNDGQRLFELQQAGCQLGFTIFADLNRGIGQYAFVDIRFTEHRQHTGVGILHVRRSVAFERQHVIPVEHVVGGTVLGQIRVFHGTNTDRVSQFFQFVGWHIRVLLCHQTTGAFQRFIQQVSQFYRAASAGFERFTVFAEHHPEHVVFQRNRIRHVARFTHNRPRLHQVLVLTGIDVVQHAIGMKGFVTVFRAGNIGGGVQIAAILFLDDHAHRFAFLVFVLIKEHHRCAFALYRQTFRFKIGHNSWQHWVIQAFTHHIVTGQSHVQTVIG